MVNKYFIRILQFFICNFFFFIFLIITLILKLKFYHTSLTLILLSLLFILPSIDNFKNNKNSSFDNEWQDFNEVEISQIIDDNKIIFLDITADWCITCQFNKVNVINSKK